MVWYILANVLIIVAIFGMIVIPAHFMDEDGDDWDDDEEDCSEDDWCMSDFDEEWKEERYD